MSLLLKTAVWIPLKNYFFRHDNILLLVDAAMNQLYNLEDEEGAVEMYRKALNLLDDPNNHDPALDALLKKQKK